MTSQQPLQDESHISKKSYHFKLSSIQGVLIGYILSKILTHAKNINNECRINTRFGGKNKNMSPDEGPPPPPSALSGLFSEMLIVLGILLGLLLIWIAQLVGIHGGATTDANKIKLTLKGIGAFLSIAALIGGGILNRNIDKFVRFGMILVAGWLLTIMLGTII